MITNIFAGHKNGCRWAGKISSKASRALVKLVTIMFIRVEAVLLSGTAETFGMRNSRVCSCGDFVSIRVKVANVLHRVEDKICRTLKLVGNAPANAFVVVMRVLRVNDVIACLVALADARLGWRNRRRAHIGISKS